TLPGQVGQGHVAVVVPRLVASVEAAEGGPEERALRAEAPGEGEPGRAAPGAGPGLQVLLGALAVHGEVVLAPGRLDRSAEGEPVAGARAPDPELAQQLGVREPGAGLAPRVGGDGAMAEGKAGEEREPAPEGVAGGEGDAVLDLFLTGEGAPG